MAKNQPNFSDGTVLTVCIKPLFFMYLLISVCGYGLPPVKTILKIAEPIISYSTSLAPVDVCRIEGFGSVDANDTSDSSSSMIECESGYDSSVKPFFHGKKKAEIQFQHIINNTARRYQVEPAIIKAIIMAESSFNPKAESKRGARGLMQLMPRTAKYLGVKDSFNPLHNIDGGVRYFKRLLNRFDSNIELALAAYNAGSRNVNKYGGIPPFKETKFYIKKVLKYYEVYKNNSSDSKDENACMT